MKKEWKGKLPSGKETTSKSSYTKSWYAAAEPLCEAIGARLCAYDPGLVIYFEGRAIELPVDLVMAVNKALRKGKPLIKSHYQDPYDDGF